MYGALVSCFERWRDNTIEENKMKSKALKVVQRKLNGALAKCLYAWNQFLVEETHTMMKLKSFTNRLLLRTLSAVMSTWCENCMELRTVAAIDLKVVARWRKRTVVMCVDSWQKCTLEKMKKQTKIWNYHRSTIKQSNSKIKRQMKY